MQAITIHNQASISDDHSCDTFYLEGLGTAVTHAMEMNKALFVACDQHNWMQDCHGIVSNSK